MVIIDLIQTYWLYLKYDPTFTVSVFSLLVQIGVLIITLRALSQIFYLKKQTQYSLSVNKINALTRFQDIIRKFGKIENRLNKKFYELSIELQDYKIEELEKSEKAKSIFKEWISILNNHPTIRQDLINLANQLELFCIALEDRDIFLAVKDMIAQTFCEIIEGNPATYIRARNSKGAEVHNRFQYSIKFYKEFITTVGSIEKRKQLEKDNLEIWKKIR